MTRSFLLIFFVGFLYADDHFFIVDITTNDNPYTTITIVAAYAISDSNSVRYPIYGFTLPLPSSLYINSIMTARVEDATGVDNVLVIRQNDGDLIYRLVSHNIRGLGLQIDRNSEIINSDDLEILLIQENQNLYQYFVRSCFVTAPPESSLNPEADEFVSNISAQSSESLLNPEAHAFGSNINTQPSESPLNLEADAFVRNISAQSSESLLDSEAHAFRSNINTQPSESPLNLEADAFVGNISAQSSESPQVHQFMNF